MQSPTISPLLPSLWCGGQCGWGIPLLLQYYRGAKASLPWPLQILWVLWNHQDASCSLHHSWASICNCCQCLLSLWPKHVVKVGLPSVAIIMTGCRKLMLATLARKLGWGWQVARLVKLGCKRPPTLAAEDSLQNNTSAVSSQLQQASPISAMVDEPPSDEVTTAGLLASSFQADISKKTSPEGYYLCPQCSLGKTQKENSQANRMSGEQSTVFPYLPLLLQSSPVWFLLLLPLLAKFPASPTIVPPPPAQSGFHQRSLWHPVLAWLSAPSVQKFFAGPWLSISISLN